MAAHTNVYFFILYFLMIITIKLLLSFTNSVRNYKKISNGRKNYCIKFVNLENFLYICLLKRRLTLKNNTIMKSLGYLGAFFGGALAGAVIGLLLAPEKGEDTRVKITDAVDDFMKKHNIKLSRKEVKDLVDDIAEAAPEVEA